MSRSTNRLTVRQVATINVPGRYDDGGGLYLSVTSEGSRSWFFMNGHAEQLSEIELGDTASLSLTMARRLAVDMRYAIAAGQDPRAVLSPTVAEEQGTIPTFGAFALSYITSVESGFKDPRHRQNWRNSLYTYAKPLLSKPINEIGTDDVMAVLNPIWPRQMARRLRGRIEKVFEAAKAFGFRPPDATNPAAWRGHLAHLLPAPPRLAKGHHPALSWKEAPTFIAELRARQALTARCLEFVILTATRSGEGLGSTWGEMDLEFKLWSIPATRMSHGVKHVVPLSSAAVALLKDVRPKVWEPDMLVFGVKGAPLSDRAISMLLRRMKRESVTTYGFRSTFRDWARATTNSPSELVEQALSHAVSGEAERSVAFKDGIRDRRELMEAWSTFLNLRSK